MKKNPLVSIIIPVYNEEKLVKPLLKKVNSVKRVKKEIIIINDGSTDKTASIIKNDCKNLFNKFINYKINRGKGFACRLGIKKASGEIIIIQDGDLEYNPKNYQRLIKPIKDNKFQIVYGSRVLDGAKRTRPKTLSFAIRIFANHFLTFFLNIWLGYRFKNDAWLSRKTCCLARRQHVVSLTRETYLSERGII